MDELVEEARSRAPVVLVDFHAEATSEKVAMARWLDGRVTAVVGTHTHVQTNDARVQPGGTAAITDAGMTGPHDSVIGVDADVAIQRMRTGMAVRFRPAEGDVRIEGVLVECDGGRPGDVLRSRAGERLMLAEHVERFNEAVRSGDYGPMLAAFAPDAEMRFEGVPVGPFVGREAIAAAYAQQPPDDEVVLLTEPRVEGDTEESDYAWKARGDARRPDDPHRAGRPDRAPRRHLRVARVRATLNRPRPSEHGEQRDEHEVADEHRPRRDLVEVEREDPVAVREPRLRQQAGGGEEPARPTTRAVPTRAGRAG